MKTYYIPTSCGVSFGSGSGSVCLVADGVRVRGDGGGYGNGFLVRGPRPYPGGGGALQAHHPLVNG
jgi:hypothetical protein